MTIEPTDRKLYEACTYAATPRLEALRTGDAVLTKADVLELFQTFEEGSADCGVPPTMQDFGNWLAGTGYFVGEPGGAITW